MAKFGVIVLGIFDDAGDCDTQSRAGVGVYFVIVFFKRLFNDVALRRGVKIDIGLKNGDSARAIFDVGEVVVFLHGYSLNLIDVF